MTKIIFNKKAILSIVSVLLFLFSVFFVTISRVTPQGYYMNVNETITAEYYKDLEITKEGKIEYKNKYENSLGEFLFSIDSGNVYKVDFDKDGELIKYHKRDHIFIPKFSEKGGIVKEIREIRSNIPQQHLSTIELENDRISMFSYKDGKVTLKEVLVRERKEDGVSTQLIKDANINYYYNSNDELNKEVYKNYNSKRSVSSIYTKYHYKSDELVKKEVFGGNDDLLYYFVYKGDKTLHYRPDGEVVKEYINNKDGIFTIEFYPSIMKKIGSKFTITANDKYPKGVKIGFNKDKNGIISGFSRIFPQKHGFSRHEYHLEGVSNQRLVIEDVFYIKAVSWEEASTKIQNGYIILSDVNNPRFDKLPFKWMDKNDNNLFRKLPENIKGYLYRRSHLFLGAEYAIVGEITEPQGGGPTTLAEVYNKKGERAWCDLFGSYIFFVAKLSDGKELTYNKLLVKSKGYEDFETTFDMNKDEKVVNLGSFSLEKEI